MRVHHLAEILEVKSYKDKAKDLDNFFNGRIKNAKLAVPLEEAIDINRSIIQTIEEAAELRERVVQKYARLPQFDMQNIYNDLPTTTAEELARYTQELVKADIDPFPYDDFIVSFVYGCENLLRVTRLDHSSNVLYLEMWQVREGISIPHFTRTQLELVKPTPEEENQEVQILVVAGQNGLESAFNEKDDKSNEEWFIRSSTNFMGFLFVFLGILQTEGVIIEKKQAPQTLNRVRRAKGKVPISDINEIRIVVGGKRYNIDGHEEGGGRSSKRLHWRRGHIRRCASGIITNVRPCLVGDISKGDAKTPSYKITKGAA